MPSFLRIGSLMLLGFVAATAAFAAPQGADPPRPGEGKSDQVRIAIGVAGGNMRLGRTAQMSVFDAVDGATGTSGDFQHEWTGGLRIEGDNGGWWRVGGDFSATSVESPVTLAAGRLTRQQTIHFMEGAFSVLGMAQIPLRVVQPYAGLGPTLLVSGPKEDIRLSVGAQFVAGARVLLGTHVYAFAEARYQALGGRTYHFDTFGVQDAPFPTVTAKVHGGYTAVVFGGGIRLSDNSRRKKTS